MRLKRVTAGAQLNILVDRPVLDATGQETARQVIWAGFVQEGDVVDVPDEAYAELMRDKGLARHFQPVTESPRNMPSPVAEVVGEIVKEKRK